MVVGQGQGAMRASVYEGAKGRARIGACESILVSGSECKGAY